MKISAIETVRIESQPYVVFVRVHTDSGLIGTSDTYYASESVAAFLHHVAAPVALGRDPFQVERTWEDLYRLQMARWGGFGVELRALSALDAAIWDIRGQALGTPVYQLLGGLAQDGIRTYNTCASPAYGTAQVLDDGSELDDLWAQWHAPERLAESLLSEGITAMKIWPFDRFHTKTGGRGISSADLKDGLEPFRRIRKAVGDDIEIMLEGHGYWDLATAKRIAGAVEEYRPAWLEDLVLAHDIDAIAELRSSTSSPVIASEMLATRYQYRRLMERRAADLVMVDPTWAGGITESRKIIVLAEAFGLSVAVHDCTGPFTLFAGIQLALSSSQVIYQESVRAFLRSWYAEMINEELDIVDGVIQPPAGPGIGASLRESVLSRPDAIVQMTELR